MKKLHIIGMLLPALLLTGCLKPVKVLTVEEIRPNETAWAIPLDAQSKDGQVKFNSVEYLNQRKVASKRIMVDKVERSIGRFSWDIEWIDAVRVIRVDRSLVTRKWANKTCDIGVVTRDSVRLRVGLTITASIDEEDASTYLYYHKNQLPDVLDINVKSFAEAELTKEYSMLTLEQAQTNGVAIFNQLFKDAKEAFKLKGINIQYLGNAEGLSYEDEKVQAAINKSYTAQQDAKTAAMEQDAQKVRNATAILTKTAEAQAENDAQVIRNHLKIATAQADADAAKALLAAKEASEFQNQLKIKLLEAEAKMKMASTWNGAMPTSIIPSDSPMLMNLGAGSSK